MAKVLLQHSFKNPDGVELTKDNLPPSEDRKNILTARDVMIVALTNEFPEDQNPANIVQAKLTRFALYQKLNDSAPTDEILMLTSEDCTLLKDRVARAFSMLIVGPMCQMFDGKLPVQELKIMPSDVRNGLVDVQKG